MSALLVGEQELVDKDVLKKAMLEMEEKSILVELTGIDMYKKYDKKKGWMWLVALTVESDDIVQLGFGLH